MKKGKYLILQHDKDAKEPVYRETEGYLYYEGGYWFGFEKAETIIEKTTTIYDSKNRPGECIVKEKYRWKVTELSSGLLIGNAKTRDKCYELVTKKIPVIDDFFFGGEESVCKKYREQRELCKQTYEKSDSAELCRTYWHLVSDVKPWGLGV